LSTFVWLILLQTADWTIAHNFGILQYASGTHLVVRFNSTFVGFIGAYLVHLVEHKKSYGVFI
jgi:hypothetical protein